MVLNRFGYFNQPETLICYLNTRIHKNQYFIQFCIISRGLGVIYKVGFLKTTRHSSMFILLLMLANMTEYCSNISTGLELLETKNFKTTLTFLKNLD